MHLRNHQKRIAAALTKDCGLALFGCVTVVNKDLHCLGGFGFVPDAARPSCRSWAKFAVFVVVPLGSQGNYRRDACMPILSREVDASIRAKRAVAAPMVSQGFRGEGALPPYVEPKGTK